MNAGTDPGLIPANESVSARPIVTAGLAKDVDAAKKYAAAMYAPTAGATNAARPVRSSPKITVTNPNVGNDLREQERGTPSLGG